jgi:transcriptional regulator with XRE-family HTH domain
VVVADDRGKAFAKLIIEGRRVRGWRQEDLVAASGVSRRLLTRWEGGEAERPDPDKVRAVCVALGIDPRRAAVALGYLSADEVENPQPAKRSPTIEEVIEILEDPEIPDAKKLEWIAYLRYLREERRNSQRAAG